MRKVNVEALDRKIAIGSSVQNIRFLSRHIEDLTFYEQWADVREMCEEIIFLANSIKKII